MCSDSNMSSNDVLIRNVTDEDADYITEAFQKHFMAYEPIRKCLYKKHKEDHQTISAPFRPQYNKELSLIAVLPVSGKRVGFLLNDIHTPELAVLLEEKAEKILTGVPQIIQRFFCTFYRRCDIFKRYGIDKAVLLDKLSVDPEYCGRQIGLKLVEHGLKVAENAGFKVAYIEANSFYTSKIAEKLNMECLLDIPYKDYRDENGEQIIDPAPPHTNAKLWVKVF